jgi:endoglucanase
MLGSSAGGIIGNAGSLGGHVPQVPGQRLLIGEGCNLSAGAWNPIHLHSGHTTRDTDYTYPTRQELDYYTSKGFNLFRLTVHPANLLGPDGNLNSGTTGAVDRAIVGSLIDYAASKGARTIIDVHDFGWTMNAQQFGQPGANADFAFEWECIANTYKDRPGVIWGLCNEPESVALADWLAAANGAIAAIRATGSTHLILIDAYDSFRPGNDATSMLAITDSANNYAFEWHQYFDGSGTSNFVNPGAGATINQNVVNWARTHNVKIFFGEFGFGYDSNSLLEGRAQNDFVHRNQDVIIGQTYWVGGPWIDPNDVFILEPLAFMADAPGYVGGPPIDRPQMGVLDDYLGAGGGTTGPALPTTINNFAAWTGDGASRTANATTAPDGATTASKVVEGSGSGIHEMYLVQNFTPPWVIYAKAAERGYIHICAVPSGGVYTVVVDLSSGAVTDTHSSGTVPGSGVVTESMGSGWWKITIAMSVTITALNIAPSPTATETPTNEFLDPVYTGNGSSGIYVW